MIVLEYNRLVFQFPQVHKKAICSISFQRTLRIPDDGKVHFLPPGMGNFPLRHLDDYADRIPERWSERGGVILPMHQSEAMWIYFRSNYPFAVKIATGKINAISGELWRDSVNRIPQDYVVIPTQPWLDGYCVKTGVIRQFVAMPLGEKYTAEEQITGKAQHGGIQIVAYPMKASAYKKHFGRRSQYTLQENNCLCAMAPDMGLAPGGQMKQVIYDDPYELNEWDLETYSRCFITIANSQLWHTITGEIPPTMPPTAKEYTQAGLPWFDYYGENQMAVKGTTPLKSLKSVKEIGQKKGKQPLPDNESVTVKHVIKLGKKSSQCVRESSF